MLFNSPIFLFIFLPAVIAVYFLSGQRLRNPVLLIASWIFYVWGEPVFFPLLFLSIGMNYVFGKWIERRHTGERSARNIVLLGVAANLSVLIFFKYSYFLALNLDWLLARLGLGVPEVMMTGTIAAYKHLPLGISFFTFQALSYILDVYRKINPPAATPYRMALYLSLFPGLISGPLVRYRDLSKQFDSRQETVSDFAEGARRFIFGLSKKVLLAGTLGSLSNNILHSSGNLLSPSVAWLGLIAYALQIYYDFSGYTDMAIGTARIFGIRLPENFNYPYISQSITEFWRRWHITLSNWFRDYVYFPLERTRRRTTFDRYTNILIVFFLTGLWHGASWNFIFWGLAQGGFIVFERSRAGALLARLPRPVRHLYGVLAIMFSWTLFRFTNLEAGLNLLRALFGFSQFETAGYPAMFLNPEIVLALFFGVLFCLPIYPALLHYRERLALTSTTVHPPSVTLEWVENGIALVLLAFSLVYLAGSTANAFIYFRF